MNKKHSREPVPTANTSFWMFHFECFNRCRFAALCGTRSCGTRTFCEASTRQQNLLTHFPFKSNIHWVYTIAGLPLQSADWLAQSGNAQTDLGWRQILAKIGRRMSNGRKTNTPKPNWLLSSEPFTLYSCWAMDEGMMLGSLAWTVQQCGVGIMDLDSR